MALSQLHSSTSSSKGVCPSSVPCASARAGRSRHALLTNHFAAPVQGRSQSHIRPSSRNCSPATPFRVPAPPRNSRLLSRRSVPDLSRFSSCRFLPPSDSVPPARSVATGPRGTYLGGAKAPRPSCVVRAPCPFTRAHQTHHLRARPPVVPRKTGATVSSKTENLTSCATATTTPCSAFAVTRRPTRPRRTRRHRLSHHQAAPPKSSTQTGCRPPSAKGCQSQPCARPRSQMYAAGAASFPATTATCTGISTVSTHL